MAQDTRKGFQAQMTGLDEYLHTTFQPEDDVLRAIRANAEKRGLDPIHVSPHDGRLLTFFARLVGAQTIVEFGTLAGYSAVCLARGMKPGGTLTTFEKNPQTAAIAQEHLEMAGLADRVKIVVGEALHNLSSISKTSDLVFIDADKVNYPNYLSWALENVRPGGLILGDNTLAWGDIAKETVDPTVQGLQKYNLKAAQDPRVFSVLFPTGEGLTASVRI